MTQEEQFIDYLEHSSGLATTTQKQYIVALSRISDTIARIKKVDTFDIYQVQDVQELDEIIGALKQDNGFKDYDKKWHNKPSAALNYYREFISGLNPVMPNNKEQNKGVDSRQIIFFGTPGSGKSYRVKVLTEKKRVHRTTFHPDSDYASFVGCYKPTMQSNIQDNLSLEELIQRIPEIQYEDNAIAKFAIKYYKSIRKLPETPEKKELRKKIQEFKGSDSNGETQYSSMNQAIALGLYLEQEKLWRDDTIISYSFTPQVFTEAYVDAWKNTKEEVYLVIEEINRGNCAQIFGDLFQLLDRNDDDYSVYPITADSDLRDYLYGVLGEGHEGIKDGKLCLPPNLRIFATMNTSDQSLFPMDSAFKRRWDWEYVPVDYRESVLSSSFVISLGSKKYRWVKFLQTINQRIFKATNSEDKQMGNFFIKADVSEFEFKSKVMFYLWNEVCRDEYGTQNNFFRFIQNDKDVEFSFNDLYQTDGCEKLQGFMDYLGVPPLSLTEGTEEEQEEPEQD